MASPSSTARKSATSPKVQSSPARNRFGFQPSSKRPADDDPMAKAIVPTRPATEPQRSQLQGHFATTRRPPTTTSVSTLSAPSSALASPAKAHICETPQIAAASELKNGDTKSLNDGGEVCAAKAAYLCIKSSTGEDLDSADDFLTALQFYGFNPTSDVLARRWTKSKMTFPEFSRVVVEEGPVPSAHDLINFFKKLDISSCGWISKSAILKLLTTRGDQLSHDVVLSVLNNPKYFHDSASESFNYELYCRDVVDTSEALLRHVKSITAETDRNFSINSKTYKIRSKSVSPSKVVVSWDKEQVSKGSFYFEGESLISHQYIVEVKAPQAFEISIQPLDVVVDCQLFIFKINDVVASRNSESKYLLIERTPIAMPYLENVAKDNQRGKDGKPPKTFEVSWRGTLERGSYLLVPSTTGCLLKKRKSQPPSSVELVEVIVNSSNSVNQRVRLSDKFRNALATIFRQVDLDGSGGLSRQEFNLFNWRTSGEEVQDEEWIVLEKNFDLVNGELALQGFLQLHQMEAEDNSGDSAELWVTLNAMGFNHNLLQDEAAPYQVKVKSESCASELFVSGLRSGGPILDKATIRCIMERARNPKLVENCKDVMVFREDGPDYASIVVQNKSPRIVKLLMDFSESENALINHPHLSFTTTLTARSTLFVAHLIPENPSAGFRVVLNVSFQQDQDVK